MKESHIEITDKGYEKAKQDLELCHEQRLFYQHILLKFVRDNEVVKDDPKKQTDFDKIYEYSTKVEN